ncbi:MAG TPA: hypothetical protein VFX88_26325 [Actinomycetota bacterium]|nr:hypothetical protein [Actinomycetota bacterium]
MTDPATALAGRRERSLLELPSVARMAAVLAERCREPSWIRTLVASLGRFSELGGHDDLEALLEAARGDVRLADRSLVAFARILDGQPDAAVAGLAMGAKVWFRLNGVPVAWRPLPAAAEARRLPEGGLADAAERLLVVAPIGSGLHLAELLRVRVGDLGSLDADGRVLPDPEAEPLAVHYSQRRGRRAERITFLSFPARTAVLEHLARRRLNGLDTGPEAPLIAGPAGRPAGRAEVARARRRSNAIIRAGSNLNVELCRKTGEFFREWGPPGSRFTPVSRLIPTPSPEGGQRP